MIELSEGNAEKITARAVAVAAAEGDSIALEIVNETAHWLARGLLIVIRILNPDRIVLGGGVAQAGKVLLAPLHEAMRPLATAQLPATTEIVLAELENYSPLYGAAALAMDQSS